jgi:uncharacterized protein YjiS (DUF1127 family)
MHSTQTTHHVVFKGDFLRRLRHVSKAVPQAFGEWRQARAEHLDLARADARMLRDIGLTRQEVMHLRTRTNFFSILKDTLRQQDEAEADRRTVLVQKRAYAYIDAEQCWY